MRPDALRRAEPDVAALMEAEGIAMRPGPRPVIAPGVLPTLRRAILGMQLVVVRYAGSDADEPTTRILCPYGILYGGRGWLVAHVEEMPEMRLWRLDRMVSIDLLDRGFARREDLDLAAYAAHPSAYSRKSRSTWRCALHRKQLTTPRAGCFIRHKASNGSPVVR